MSKHEKTKNGAIELAFDSDTKIATLTFKMEGRINIINNTFITGLEDAIDWAIANKELKGIIVASGHKDFCAGADLDVIYKAKPGDAKTLYDWVSRLTQAYRKLETQKVPVVAALTGSALGGGYELALACHRRIAVNDPKIQVGLPEVTLGLLPGAGGTQRLPRMIGLQSGLEHILQGKIVRAPKAKAAGLVDELCESPEAVRVAAEAWIAANQKAEQPWDKKGYKFPQPRPGSTDARDLLLVASAMLEKKTAGAYLAPKYAMNAVAEGCALKFDRGLEVEVRYFAALTTKPQAKDMLRTFWYHRQAAEKHQDLPHTDKENIKKVGILGAGMMGGGLAWVCAFRGYDVVLKDIAQGALDKAIEHCKSLTSKKAKHLPEAERNAIIGRIKPTLQTADLKGCDLIIEAVVENMDIKHKVIQEIEPLLAPNGIWASNTSALPITELASVSKQPERFIGLHYFSPVDQMPLLEIITTKQTSEETLARCLAFCKNTKKTPIVVNDAYAFFTTRVFAAYIIEAAQMVAEGHPPATIEWAARAAGMAVGPLQVLDEITLSLAKHIVDQSREYMKEKDYNLDGLKLVNRMVDEFDRKGRAFGTGFYNYENGKRAGFWPGLKDVVKAKPAEGESDVELLGKRLLLAQCVEAAHAIDAGVIKRNRDVEIGAIYGLGFAPNTGGPLSYMDRMGLREVVNTLTTYSKKYGSRFAPPKVLVTMAEKGQRFFDE